MEWLENKYSLRHIVHSFLSIFQHLIYLNKQISSLKDLYQDFLSNPSNIQFFHGDSVFY